MNTHLLRFFILPTLLAVFVSACGSSDQLIPTLAQPIQTTAPVLHQPSSTPDLLGEVYRQEEGGYTYRPPLGYQVKSGLGMVVMLAEGANPDFGPSISLFGGPPDPSASAQSLLDEIKSAPDTQLGEPTTIDIAGFAGLTADIIFHRNDINHYGRVVIVVTPQVQFIALAGASWEHWYGELEPLFSTVLTSITFFTPRTVASPFAYPTPLPTPIFDVPGTVSSQWAVSATASSQDPEHPAVQAAGLPDVTRCADDLHAWAPEPSAGDGWLEVTFKTAVTPLRLTIFESFNPGQVVRVELVDTNQDVHLVYIAKAQAKTCPNLLTIPINHLAFQITAVRITVDGSVPGYTAQIDAVELLGYR